MADLTGTPDSARPRKTVVVPASPIFLQRLRGFLSHGVTLSLMGTLLIAGVAAWLLHISGAAPVRPAIWFVGIACSALILAWVAVLALVRPFRPETPEPELASVPASPKSSVESLVGVLGVYHDMTKKRIRDVLGELFEELEESTIPAGAAGNEYVLRALDRYVEKMDAEHNENSSRADKMREDLASETDEDKKQFTSTIGLMIEGASMAAKLTRNHLQAVRKRFVKESRKVPSGKALTLLRRTVDQLEAESEHAKSV